MNSERRHLRLLEPGPHSNRELLHRRRTRADYVQRLRTVALRRPDTVFALWSAAVLHELPLSEGLPRTMHVTGERNAVSFADGVIVHRPAVAGRAVELGGLCATDPATTAIDLAGRCAFPQAVVIADHVLARGLVTAEELIELAADATGPGASAALRVARFADGRADSPLESLSRATMALIGAPAPDVQVEIVDGSRARVDFAWPDHGLVGEADGFAKYAHPALRRDRSGWEVLAEQSARQSRLEALGLRVVRWDWGTARRPDRLAAVLAGAGLPLRDTPGLQHGSASGKLV